MAEALSAALPHAYVAISSQVWPELREHERGMTTLLSAYVGPVMSQYLQRLHEMLRSDGFACPVYVMDSAGGVMSAEHAARRPIFTIESGGAAGVVAAGQLGTRYDLETRAVVRHGRHDRQGRAGSRWCADHHASLRGQRQGQLRRHASRIRPSREDPGGRPCRGGRRRRKHRLDRRHRSAARRTTLGRRRPRAGVLRPRRHRTHRHGCQSRAGLPRSGRTRRRRPSRRRRRRKRLETRESPCRSACQARSRPLARCGPSPSRPWLPRSAW